MNRIIIQTMAQVEALEEMHPILALRMDPNEFDSRFRETKGVEDCYCRFYQICSDRDSPSRRVAVRRYIADDPQKTKDVLQNMESYRQLSEVDGMSNLIAFCLNPQAGEVQAAFQYDTHSLQEVMEDRLFAQSREELYLFISRELLSVISSASKIGIEVEELVPENILIELQGTTKKLKLLYDEREKQFDKILEGLKAFVSPQKAAAELQLGQEAPTAEREIVFQMGLLLLQIIHLYETHAESQLFSKDTPLLRKRANQGYLLFGQDSPPELNAFLVDQKVKYLQGKSPLVDGFLLMIQAMIADPTERISLHDLDHQIDTLDSLLQQNSQQQASLQQAEVQIPQKDVYKQEEADRSEGKQSLQLEVREEDAQKMLEDGYGQKREGNVNVKHTFISQTTVATAKKKSQETITYPDKQPSAQISLPQHSQPIPSLSSQVQYNSRLRKKFQEFRDGLPTSSVAKEYFDKSTYYGQVEEGSQKRQGRGIFACLQGDIYFGHWQGNTLKRGVCLFRNGEGFEGTVQKGKQGFGTYFYRNGNVYSGDWLNDVKHGQGRMEYPNGDQYQGTWKGGKKNGQGSYRYANGTFFQGTFVNGRKEGWGVTTFPNGTKVEATWEKTHVEGPGKVLYHNGNYFEGQYHRSQKHGEGLYAWEDAQYRGGFEKDALEGVAKVKFSEEQFYEGRIKNGRRCGRGRYRYSNGDQFEGEWKNDEKLYGVYRFREGEAFDGKFKNNQISFGVMTYANGQCYEGQFARGEREGVGTYREAAGGKVILEGRWANDHFLSQF